MEDTLRAYSKSIGLERETMVLILVVMEDTLRVYEKKN